MWRDFNFETDYEAIVLLHEKMQRRIGRDFPLPNPSLRPTLVCLVREDAAGEITHFALAEAEMEVSIAGESAITPQDFIPVVDRFISVAQYYSIGLARMFVPRDLLDKSNGRPGAIRRLLESESVGFTEENQQIATFYKWIPPAEEAA